MISKIKDLYLRYTSPLNATVESGTLYWKEKIFLSLYVIGLFFGFFAYILAIYFAIKSQSWGVAVFDSAAYFITLFIMGNRRIPLKYRSSSALAIFFVFSIFFTFFQGPFSAGLTYLFAFPLLLGLFHGIKQSLVGTALNMLAFIIATILLYIGHISPSVFGVADMNQWIVLSLNFIFMNVVTTFSVSLLQSGFESLLEKEKTSGITLAQEREQLLATNEQLKEEIEERKRTEKALRVSEEKAAFYETHDTVTKLPNRETFINILDIEVKKALNRKQTFAVMCIGIDKFKNINNMYTHGFGDKLLRVIGERLEKALRQNDSLCRFSGDKFVLLFSDLSRMEDVFGIVKKMFHVINEPFNVEKSIMKITSSIGICLYPNDGGNGDVLLKNSETAMYTAKDSGRNTYRLFNEKMNSEMISRMKMEKELQEAINKDEFVAYYQPKVDHSGLIIGMESLIRWNSPEKGLIPPYQFIPVAEKTGMIVDIGKTILMKSCMQNKKWQMQGYAPKKVAVNLSPFELKQFGLIANIADTVKRSGLDPQWLELEITESGIMENEKEAIKILTNIHEMGISISIDDFGTGYSSLSKLKDYPIDTLKIDKIFVDNLPNDKKSVTIVTSIIDLAHNLGFKVVAEGVEKQEQLEFLKSYNCDQFQGYYFSKPVSTEDFEMKLKAG